MSKQIHLIHAISPLHVGGGTSLGLVDQPILREKHTSFPYVPGSALKGTFRSWWHLSVKDRIQEDKIFGPMDGISDNAGEVIFGDASLLLLPIRSFRGVYALATSPLAWNRLHRAAPHRFPSLIQVESGKAQVSPNTKLISPSGKVILEEFDLISEKKSEVDQMTQALDKFLNNQVAIALNEHLVVLEDEDFQFYARQACEVQAHVRINSETKTVENGALWYSEYLPAESLLWTFTAPRIEERGEPHQALLAKVKVGALALQLGGDETTGKGQCLITTQEVNQ